MKYNVLIWRTFCSVCSLFRALANSTASEVTDNHIALTILSHNEEEDEDIVIGSVVIPVIELQNQLQSTAWYPLHGRVGGSVHCTL